MHVFSHGQWWSNRSIHLSQRLKIPNLILRKITPKPQTISPTCNDVFYRVSCIDNDDSSVACPNDRTCEPGGGSLKYLKITSELVTCFQIQNLIIPELTNNMTSQQRHIFACNLLRILVLNRWSLRRCRICRRRWWTTSEIPWMRSLIEEWKHFSTFPIWLDNFMKLPQLTGASSCLGGRFTLPVASNSSSRVAVESGKYHSSERRCWEVSIQRIIEIMCIVDWKLWNFS